MGNSCGKSGKTDSVDIRRRRLSVAQTNDVVVGETETELILLRPEGPCVLPISCDAAILGGFDPLGEGLKKECQDDVILLIPFGNDSNEPLALFGVFDGHGKYGRLSANFCTQHVPMIITKSPGFDKREYRAVLTAAMENLDDQLVQSSIDVNYSGSTACVAILHENHLYVANVGDSKAVLGRQESDSITTIELTQDQKPTDPEEFARIQRAGGRVEPMKDEDGTPLGPERVWLPTRNLPGIAMSRSLGDRVAHSVGVIATPVITEHVLDAQDRFILIASDGVWEVMTPKLVVDFVATKITELGWESIIANERPDELNIAELVAKEAQLHWKKLLEEEDTVVDDISVVIVFVNYAEAGIVVQDSGN